MAKQEKVLKIWNDWKDGVGYLLDKEGADGMYYSEGLLGLDGELRVGPYIFEDTAIVKAVTPTWTMGSDNDITAACVVSFIPDDGTAVTLLGSVTSGTAVTSTTCTITSHTVTAGTDILIVGISYSSTATTITSVTWNGAAEFLSQACIVKMGNNCNTAIFYLLNPTATTANIVVTLLAARSIVAGALNFDNVNTDEPFLCKISDYRSIAPQPAGASFGTTVPYIDNGTTIGGIFSVASIQNANSVTVSDLTARYSGTAGTVDGAGGTLLGAQNATEYYMPQYYFEEPVWNEPEKSYLYIIREVTNTQDNNTIGTFVEQRRMASFAQKVSLKNSNFGTLQDGILQFMSPTFEATDTDYIIRAGQPARYHGNWHIGCGGEGYVTIEDVADGRPSLDANNGTTSEFSGAGNYLQPVHFILFGNQVASISYKDPNIVYTTDVGVNILKQDGVFGDQTNWGASFRVGDPWDRPLSVAALGKLIFVLTREGLYSFNKRGRAGLVVDDIKVWGTQFTNYPMQGWKEGLIILTPGGMLFYRPGGTPFNIGVDSKPLLHNIPQSTDYELHGGTYYGMSIIGEYVYALYQPDPTIYDYLILVGYSQTNDPLDLTWQVLGKVTGGIAEGDSNLGLSTNCFVSVQGKPVSSSYTTPTLWFATSGGEKNAYIKLAQRASPFLTRSESELYNRTTRSAQAYMSELEFDNPLKITELIVDTQDLVNGTDEFDFSIITNTEVDEENIGKIVTNGRTKFKINRRDNVYRATLRVQYQNNEGDAVAPTIEGTTYGTEISSGSSLTFSHTVPNKNNRLLVVRVGAARGGGTVASVSGITYGGVALTSGIATKTTGLVSVSSEIWYLIAPAVGTADVVVTMASAALNRLNAFATNLINVAQTSPEIDDDSATGTATTSTLSAIVASATQKTLDNLTLGTNGAITVDPAQRVDFYTSGADPQYQGSSADGEDSMTWSWTTSSIFAHTAIVFNGVTLPYSVRVSPSIKQMILMGEEEVDDN